MALDRTNSARVVLVLVAIGALLVGCDSSDRAGTGRVTASASGLQLDGTPWWPAGINAYQLGTDWSVNTGCGAQVDLDDFFGRLPPKTLTRFDLFQSLGRDKTTGAIDFAPLDAVFAAAERHDQLLVPVLAGQDGACDDGEFKQYDWYRTGWRTAHSGSSRMTYQQWVTTAVERWRNSPSIAAWELMGEPEASVCSTADCAAAARTCPSDATAVLLTFVDDVGATVHKLDPSRLTTVGFIGGNQCGTAGSGARAVAASDGVDILQYHDYSLGTVVIPGDDIDGLRARLRDAAAVGKPLLIGEIGVNAGGTCADLDTRSAQMAAKVDGQRSAGAAGALLWSFVPDPRNSLCTYDIGPEDPVWSVLANRTTHG